jgi:hypothetical protein
MNLAQFNISFKNSIELLKKLKLYKGLGNKTIGDYSEETKKLSKKNKYKEIYDLTLKNLDYEIILVDDSVFQFSFTPIRYGFIQNPLEFVSKQNYLLELYSNDEFLDFSDDELNLLLDSINEDEYEQFLNEQEINKQANYIRYDATDSGYRPLIHSYSHIHIGMNENLRIPSSRIITPFCFVMFCIRNTYYDDWKDAIVGIPDFQNMMNDCKLNCNQLIDTYWGRNEELELYLR